MQNKQLPSGLKSKIEDKAKEYCSCKSEMCFRRQDFTAGAEYALSLQGDLLKEFGDWLWRNYRQIDAQIWQVRNWPDSPVYTIHELVMTLIKL